MASIAPDPSGWTTALRFDIDREGGGAAWIDAGLPPPNLIVVNPKNGHAHLIYQLGAWVRTDFGIPGAIKVMRYAAAIERAYEAALGGDPGYSGRFHHNPLSPHYSTRVGRDKPYSLDELAQYVDLKTSLPKRRPLGIGRNVALFDRLRRWAYAAVAEWRIGPFDGWHAAVRSRAAQIAGDVGAESPRGPLPENEVGHTVKSVARWVWEHYKGDVPPLLQAARDAAKRERERARQATREPLRGRSRMTRDEYRAQASERRRKAEELRTQGTPLRAIAEELRCSLSEVRRLLRHLVQGSPAPSDFGVGGVPAALTELDRSHVSAALTELDRSHVSAALTELDRSHVSAALTELDRSHVSAALTELDRSHVSAALTELDRSHVSAALTELDRSHVSAALTELDRSHVSAALTELDRSHVSAALTELDRSHVSAALTELDRSHVSAALTELDRSHVSAALTELDRSHVSAALTELDRSHVSAALTELDRSHVSAALTEGSFPGASWLAYAQRRIHQIIAEIRGP